MKRRAALWLVGWRGEPLPLARRQVTYRQVHSGNVGRTLILNKKLLINTEFRELFTIVLWFNHLVITAKKIMSFYIKWNENWHFLEKQFYMFVTRLGSQLLPSRPPPQTCHIHLYWSIPLILSNLQISGAFSLWSAGPRLKNIFLV